MVDAFEDENNWVREESSKKTPLNGHIDLVSLRSTSTKNVLCLKRVGVKAFVRDVLLYVLLLGNFF